MSTTRSGRTFKALEMEPEILLEPIGEPSVVELMRLLEGEAVAVRCAHGDTVLYPLAEVAMEVDGVETRVRAAVSEKLPVSVLLGTDAPCLEELLQQTSQAVHTEDIMEAFVVTTRAQARQERESPETKRRKCRSQTQKDHRGGTTTEQELGW